ncbi:MAG: TerC family protein [Planctomycetales bacterium]
MTLFVWLGFLALISALILLDLGVFHRRGRPIGFREALGWTAVWVALALAFAAGVYFLYERDWLGWTETASHRLSGRQAALQFLTGHLIEKALSVDNLFVMALIFSYFRVPAAEQHRLLFWGILGAVVLRGAMIAAGAALVARFEWTMYVFGVLLIASALKLLLVRADELHPDRNLLVRLVRRFVPVTSEYAGSRFVVKTPAGWAATPLVPALILIESSDAMFAVDSIPAIFAVTRDPFLVFTSNVFAILGLRSLYFALAGLLDVFRHLKYSLVALLVFVGLKMLLAHRYPISTLASLAVIGGILALGILVSLVEARRARAGACGGPAAGRRDQPPGAIPEPADCPTTGRSPRTRRASAETSLTPPDPEPR